MRMESPLRGLLLVACLVTGCAPRQASLAPPPSALHAQQQIRLAETIETIDRAIGVVLRNLEHADATAYRREIVIVEAASKLTQRRSTEQGKLERTDRPFDVAISGEGFLRVKTDDGVFYTRNGNLFVDSNNFLVLGAGDGYRLDPPIVVPPQSAEITISEAGVVEVLVSGATARITIGQIPLYQFTNPGGLSLNKDDLFIATEASGDPIESRPGENGSGRLLQAFLESSNVNINVERLRLTALKRWRAYLQEQVDRTVRGDQ